MRIAHLIFTGSIAALAVLTPPALAKNSNTQKTDDTSTSAAHPLATPTSSPPTDRGIRCRARKSEPRRSHRRNTGRQARVRTKTRGERWVPRVIACDKRGAFAQGSESDEAIPFFLDA